MGEKYGKNGACFLLLLLVQGTVVVYFVLCTFLSLLSFSLLAVILIKYFHTYFI